MKLVTTSPGEWVGGVVGWTKTKLMLFSTQVEVVVKDGVELGNRQAGDELCQAQVKLEVVVEVVLEVGFEIGVEV